MNAWTKKEIEGEPLLEACDCCGRLIRNFDWMCMSRIDFNGNVRCMWCWSDFVKECVAKKEFDKIGCKAEDFV